MKNSNVKHNVFKTKTQLYKSVNESRIYIFSTIPVQKNNKFNLVLMVILYITVFVKFYVSQLFL